MFARIGTKRREGHGIRLGKRIMEGREKKGRGGREEGKDGRGLARFLNS
jgi:hypothetical protein